MSTLTSSSTNSLITSARSTKWNKREYRMKRQLQKSAQNPYQVSLHGYFETVDKMDYVLQLNRENESLVKSLNALKAKFCALQIPHDTNISLSGNSLLKRIMQQSISQHEKQSKGFRHKDPILEHFCMNVWILGGRKLYEIFNSNFQGVFPSPSTIERKLAKFGMSVDEGVVNVHALKEYITSNNLPPIVCLSEDATALVGRREYSSKTNSVVGFSLPLKPDGFPDTSLSIARTASDIIRQFQKYDRARYFPVNYG